MHTDIRAEAEVNTLLLIVIPLMAWVYSANCHILLFKLQTGSFRLVFFFSL